MHEKMLRQNAFACHEWSVTDGISMLDT